jgi:hypothetical protein
MVLVETLTQTKTPRTDKSNRRSQSLKLRLNKRRKRKKRRKSKPNNSNSNRLLNKWVWSKRNKIRNLRRIKSSSLKRVKVKTVYLTSTKANSTTKNNYVGTSGIGNKKSPTKSKTKTKDTSVCRSIFKRQ